jgi:hypothetical protein
MKQIRFFALKADLIPALQEFESPEALKYIRKGRFPSKECESYNRAAEIPNLGLSTAATASASASYLVCVREMPIKIRPVKDGFCIDQLLNPDTIVFIPGGIWDENVVLHGLVGTVSASERSQALMKRFHSAVRRNYLKINAFWVGPEARALLNSGKRLTIAAQSPREFDLRISKDR